MSTLNLQMGLHKKTLNLMQMMRNWDTLFQLQLKSGFWTTNMSSPRSSCST